MNEIPERDRDCLADLARCADEVAVELYVVGAGARLLAHDCLGDLDGAAVGLDEAAWTSCFDAGTQQSAVRAETDEGAGQGID